MKARIVYIITTGFSANVLLRGQLSFLRQRGYEIFLICSPGDDIENVKEREKINVWPIQINREISLIADLRALFNIVRVLKEIKPDLINCSTPKAGLLGSLAGWIVGVRVNIYTLRGLRLETTTGFKRFVLSMCEWVASACAHEVICVSNSLKMRYVELGLAPAKKIIVLGDGSSNGVDIERFRPCREKRKCENRLLEELKLPDDAMVLGFVGRIGPDKGLVELLKAFSLVCKEVRNVFLVLVGGIDAEGETS
ncbi:MAG: glycosyltransferase, partial [Deltaproteobacteria bacterium]|nr:glycosyltransferase [Deltaproteobacteria bacterium]